MNNETFSTEQVKLAIEQFLEFGAQEFGKAHQGYYSGDGWAARCLRWHLAELDHTSAPPPDAR